VLRPAHENRRKKEKVLGNKLLRKYTVTPKMDELGSTEQSLNKDLQMKGNSDYDLRQKRVAKISS
jgi:hypothetical protein